MSSTDLHTISFRYREVTVLVNQTLRLGLKLLYHVVRPPLLQVTIFVILSSFRISQNIYIFLIVRCCLWNIKLKKQIWGANFRLYFKTHIVHVFEIVILIAKFDIPSGFVCQCVTPLEVTLRCIKNGLFLIDFVAFNHSSVSKLMMGERVYFFFNLTYIVVYVHENLRNASLQNTIYLVFSKKKRCKFAMNAIRKWTLSWRHKIRK